MSLRIAFVGAGAINFGDVMEKVPWDHASRIEALAAHRDLTVVGIADPLVSKAQAVLDARLNREGPEAKLYEKCRIFASAKEMMEETRPHAVWVGVPPFAHGSLEGGKDLELQLLNAGAAVFVEKPVSASPVSEVKAYAQAVSRVSALKGLPVSVGYMFRYAKPVECIKSLIRLHAEGKVCCFNARYNTAYGSIPHRFWWMQSRSGGPLVEQATHFIDIARYLCGEVDFDSISGMAIGAGSDLGKLKRIPDAVEEHSIAKEDRIPRASVSTWRFQNGGLGVLNHGLLLQGKAYENAITIWADGLSIEWTAPYTPGTTVRVRVGESDETEVFTFPGDDMYNSEDAAFLDAVDAARSSEPSGDSGAGACGADAGSQGIRSSYDDAVATYMLSCKLRDTLTTA